MRHIIYHINGPHWSCKELQDIDLVFQRNEMSLSNFKLMSYNSYEEQYWVYFNR